MNISLTDDMKEFVQMKVASGAFPSEEAVLLEGQLAAYDRRIRIRVAALAEKNHARGPHRLRRDRLVAKDADDSITLAEVGAATSKIKDSMTRVV